jgi:flagellar protein FlgJ
MLASTLGTGMFDNEGTKLGTELLDSQLATRMAGMPGGREIRCAAACGA